MIICLRTVDVQTHYRKQTFDIKFLSVSSIIWSKLEHSLQCSQNNKDVNVSRWIILESKATYKDIPFSGPWREWHTDRTISSVTTSELQLNKAQHSSDFNSRTIVYILYVCVYVCVYMCVCVCICWGAVVVSNSMRYMWVGHCVYASCQKTWASSM